MPTFAACFCLLGIAADAPSNGLVFVKKPTREETVRASLAASGIASLPGSWSGWKIIGPFPNPEGKGFDVAYPPEQSLDTSKEYPGLEGTVCKWRDADFPDGQNNNLHLFEPRRDFGIVYLLREIVTEKAENVDVALGSDDGLKVFLNGQMLLADNAVRACAPDQNRATLRLAAGRNQLLLKIANLQGNWEFHFAPRLADRLQVELENRLTRDFPATLEDEYYRLVSFPTPDAAKLEVGGLGFQSDGSLLIGTRRGEIYRMRYPLNESFANFAFDRWAAGLHEITGMLVEGDAVHVTQRPELTLVSDRDGDGKADTFRTFCDGWGISGDYHEYAFGPVRDAAGDLFVTLNVGFGGGHQSKAPWRGWCVRIDRAGRLHPHAVGLRSPNGVGISPVGDIFYCDNQGEWVAACKMHHIRKGEYYGHPAGLRWRENGEKDPPKPIPPAIWFPYSAMSQSASQPIWDMTGGKFGLFAGQAFVGDQTKSLIMRVALEKVNGRYQGACFHFRRGFACGVNRLEFAPDGSLFVGMTNRGWGSVGGRDQGVQRVVPTGKKPFEMHAMHARPRGFKITFTKPVDPATANDLKSYALESYHYNYWSNYGSPEIDRRPVAIAAAHVADDRMSVTLDVPTLKAEKVYALTADGVRADNAERLLHPEAYYTLNEIPADVNAAR